MFHVIAAKTMRGESDAVFHCENYHRDLLPLLSALDNATSIRAYTVIGDRGECYKDIDGLWGARKLTQDLYPETTQWLREKGHEI